MLQIPHGIGRRLQREKTEELLLTQGRRLICKKIHYKELNSSIDPLIKL